VAATAIGLVLTVRPFTSLGVLVTLVAIAAFVTGVSDVVGAGHNGWPLLDTAIGVGWLALGVAVLAWPGVTIEVLALWVGVGLVVAGAARLAGGVSGSAEQRLTAVILGLATVIFGVLALSWPDVTVLVIAVVFGVRTVWFGLALIIDATRDRLDRPAEQPRPASRWRRLSYTLAAIAALAAAVVVGGASAAIHEGNPSVDAFYTPPAQVPSQPGALLRSKPFTRTIPSTAVAWRILYTTTDTNGRPTVASGIVVAPKNPSTGPRPVIAWAHGTTGYVPACAPSLANDPLGSGAFFNLDQVIANNWILVATDYIGLGTKGPQPYLIGPGEAHSVLDAVRAAKQLPDIDMANQTVVWGHSQGGNAALWTGQLAPSYAPDDHVIGVAALAPASDLVGLVDNLNTVPGGAIFASYVIAAYSATYPDVNFDTYIRPTARTIVKANAGRCLASPEVFASIVTSLLADKPIFSTDPATGPLGQRLRQNTPLAVIQAPLLLAQGDSDPLVKPAVQAAYAQQRCALGGGPLDYKTYPDRDHVGLVQADSPLIPDLLAWTKDRLARQPAPTTCHT
jgi:uncharacterized membrane protein HdeD (DUF308 family)/alpha-beta hydrolase superfamily lysophospholipase